MQWLVKNQFVWPVLLILTVLFFALYLSAQLKHDLHMLQQNSYRNERYRRWRLGRRGLEHKRAAWLPAACCLAAIFLPAVTKQGLAVSALICCPPAILCCLLLWLAERRRPAAKKPLVMTARAKRLYLVALVLPLVWGALGALLLSRFKVQPYLAYVGMLALVALAALPVYSGSYLLGVNRLLQPVERRINRGYLDEAQRVLAAREDLIRIGITGSYGKTSCKMILSAMLGEQYITLATPESVNTPMGITRIIREQLKPIHQVFICEMGAKQQGDIAELCDLVRPQVGWLTAIGPQHLETFGSQEAIAETKFELIRALPQDGLAVLNLDNPLIQERQGQIPCDAVVGYGLEPARAYHALDLQYDDKGLSFLLIGPEGRSQRFQTQLLGRHNVLNIVGAAATAHNLGVTLPKCARAVRALEPLPHRLQLIQGAGYTIIDDAFNSNPEGAAAALEVLSLMQGGRKILVTPGMVELGEQEAELNRRFAELAAGVCDCIILVGLLHSLPLQEGLQNAAYPQEQYTVVRDLNEARELLQRIVEPGDTVLFENDLPDTYNE